MPKRFETQSAAYVEVEKLRERPTGATYVVQRESDGQQFVLKELTLGQIKEWKEFDLFEREIAAIKSIDHPRVPRYVDSHLEEATGHFVLVQTKIEGVTLRDFLSSRGALSPQETESYLRQSLDLLSFLHGSSPPVIHRDITPSNIIVRDGQLFLIDFGAVKVGSRESTSMTTVGTFGYMAPEQILGRATSQSDLYGLGMTFVTLATGCRPGELPQNPTTGHIDPSAVLQAPPHVQRTLLALIRPGMAERPPTARDALALLDPAYAPPLPPGPYMMMPRPVVQSGPVSPYKAPQALSKEDKEFMRKHTLTEFPVWAAVMLHYFTFGLFSLIYYGLQHERMPQGMPSDPSAGKAIGFSFIPYFNLYWCVFSPLRLADRLNLQTQIRGQGDGVSRGLILTAGILGVIPYMNIVFGFPFWGVGVYHFQKAINRLAREAEAEKKALEGSEAPPALPPAQP